MPPEFGSSGREIVAQVGRESGQFCRADIRANIQFFAVNPDDTEGPKYETLASQSSYDVYSGSGGSGSVDLEQVHQYDELLCARKKFETGPSPFSPVNALAERVSLRRTVTWLSDMEESLTIIESAATDETLNPELARVLSEVDENTRH